MEDLELAKYCKKAYDGNVGEGDFYDQHIVIGNIEAYYYDLEKLLIIVGSNDLWDWGKNIQVNSIAGEHAGFHEMSIILYRYLYTHQIYPRVITGHSMGGAIGSLLIKYMSSIEKVVTFGSPRYYREEIKGEVATHYILGLDVVTYLPIGYKRCGKDVELKSEVLCPRRAHNINTYIRSLENGSVS